MTSARQRALFVGLDPVPIPITIAAEAILAAAGLPSTVFIRTVRPYRVQQAAADTYDLVLGPEGFGAALLEALQWLACVAAAGIVGTLGREQVIAFVQHYLEEEKPEWRFE